MDAFSPESKAKADEWSKKIIGAAIEVHRALGPGLLEGAYEDCLCHEFYLQAIPFKRQVSVDINYKGNVVADAFRVDLIVADLIIVELKSIERFHPIHEAQLLTYLRLAERWLGLLINFNVPVVKDGILRRVRG
jgi:GxxExxY protein